MNRKTDPDTALVRGKASIEFALITAFILMVTIIIVLGYINYKEYYRHFRHDVELQLGAIADLKASEISEYLKERLGQGNILFKRDSFYDSVRRFFEDPKDEKNSEFLRKWLAKYAAHYQYVGVGILDTNGMVRISVPEGGSKISDAVDLKLLHEILRADRVQIGDFRRSDQDGRVYMSVLVPILSEDPARKPLGVLVLMTDPEKYIYPFIKKWPAPSKTAETLLVRRDNKDVLFLTELKFYKNAALNLRFPIDTNKDLPAVKAVLGQRGFVEGRDYHGSLVAAYVRNIPDSPWFIVARVDRGEVYAPLRRHIANLIELIIALIISAGAIIWYILRRKDLLFYKEKYLTAKALLESEERYRRLFESARDGVLLVDVYTGKILDVNPFLTELLKYSKTEFLGRYLWDIGAFKDIVPAKENFEKLQNMGYVRYEDLPLETKHGEKIEVEFVSNVYLVGDKKIIQCNVRDITDRVRADVEIKRSAHDWQVTFDSSADMIMQLDREMNVVKANKAVIDVLGLQLNEIIGKKCHKLVHGTDLPFSECPVTKSAKTKLHESSELFFPNLNIWAIVSSDPIIGKNGEVGGFVHTVHDITERKRLEEELEQTKDAQFRTLIENLPGKVYLKDRNSTFVTCNKNYALDMKISPEDVEGKTDFDFFPTYLAEKYRADDKRVMDSGNTENFEEEYVVIGDYLNEGKKIIINTVKVAVKDKSGNVTGVFGLFWDITEKKTAEDVIKNLNKQIEFILGATKTGLDIIDSEFNMVYVDNEWRKIYGDPAGKKCYEYFMDRSEECPNCGVRKALETKNVVITEELLTKEGGRPVQVTSIPFQDKDGKWFVAEVNFDITERKNAERAIVESKALVDAVIENVPLMIFVKEAKDLRFVIFNRAGEELLGYDRKDLLGKNNLDLFPPEQSEHFMAKDREVLDGGSGVLDIPEEPIQTAKKGQRLLHTRKVCIRGADGATKYLLGISEDITESKKLEDERRGLEAIKISSDIKSKFVSMVSRELRSPMAAIKEGVNLVVEGLVGDINEEQRDLLDTVKRNADRLGRLINNVLDLQKIGSGRMDLDIQENDINETVREACKSMSLLASEKGLDLTLETDDSIPRLRFDRDRIIQVVTNLVSNAVKFTEKGGITVTTENKDPVVRVVVKDTGPGIASSDIARIFEPFEQITQLKGKKKIGTGLGLAISREILVAHGGKIGLESEEGNGSSFHFILPIKERRR